MPRNGGREISVFQQMISDFLISSSITTGQRYQAMEPLANWRSEHVHPNQPPSLTLIDFSASKARRLQKL
ncbi:hypothetical protein, partial [Pseudomonas veronii]|uniref:hypothetical protein n=1 Tax=Pseudomonas veronii TaxID=76761 RepID=UPI001E357000